MATSTQSLGLASWSARYGDDKEDCADVGDDNDRGVDKTILSVYEKYLWFTTYIIL